MRFSLFQSIKSVSRRKSNSILSILCFFFGALLLFIACCYGEAFLAELNRYQIKQGDESIYVEISPQQEETKKLVTSQNVYSFLQSYDFVNEICLTELIIIENISNETVYAYLIDENFTDTFPYTLVSGRMFSPTEYKEAGNVCMIEQDIIDRGDAESEGSIILNGKQYRIIGVISTMDSPKGIFLPISAEAGLQDAIGKFTIVARLKDLQYADRINWPQLTAGYVKAITVQEHYQQAASRLLQLFTIVFLVGVSVYLYSLINIYNIIVARVAEYSRSIGVRMAVGARPRDIFMQLYFEILLMMLAAMLIIFALDPLIDIAVRTTLNHLFGPITLLIMCVNTFVTTFIITMSLFRRIMKHSEADLMGGCLV